MPPYRMVKDLRANYEVLDPDSVIEEDVEGFILSYLSACLDKDEDDNGESDLHNFAKAEPVPHVQTLNL
ncbi:hypothetical protein ACFX13_034035 [Malus domestica]|uniref:Uncharacterized protein n=1 Tax=Malus domestica TaxID=3750 RepID=A0A498K0S7_MALDO|nr:hypothetical protein DVH24_015109 [Malus domestica]